jgi:hypothetical protein
VYGWFSWPFHQTEHIRFASEWGLGVAGGWEAFDPETNPRQTSLGLPVSALLEAGVSAAVGITEQWDLMGAAGFTHFSNGALREPNVGLNHLGIRLGVAGRFGESRSDEGEPEPLDPSLRGAATALTADGDGGNWDYSFRLASGARSIRFDRTDSVQTSRYFGEVYPVVSLTSITGRSLGAKARLMVGLDVTYDRSSDERHLIARVADGGDVVGESLSWSARSSVSILGGYTQVMGRASVGARLGVTALRGSGPGADPRFFQELALGWGISRSLTLGVDTRFVEFSRSIFMDWGITYRFGGA